MLAQDPYSGALYDVPEMSGYGDVPFDGLGFSLGPIGNILGGLIPGAGNLIGGLLGGGQAAPRPPGLPFPLPGLPSIAQPFLQNLIGGGAPSPRPFMPGWMQPQPGVSARAPRYVYMRCGVWPHQPRGLVPVTAAMQPVNGAAIPAVPVVPAVPAVPMGGGRRHHRLRRYR